jgi:hypothetical protein
LADEAALIMKTLEAFEDGRMLLISVHKAVLRDVLERAGAQFPRQESKLRRRSKG